MQPLLNIDRRTMLAMAASAAAHPLFARTVGSGVHTDRLVFGQVAALSGPASALGLGMRDGLNAAFREVNLKGGVTGRRLDLISRDDGYEPDRSLEETRQLIAEGVVALVGAVGTPTSLAALPLAEAADIPFIGAFTGAEGLRSPAKPHIVNIRASYYQETEMMVERLTKDLGLTRIAILYQDDAFGRAGLAGLEMALARRQMKLVEEAVFPRNTTAIKTALIDLREADPQAVVIIGPYAPCAAFIRFARRAGFDRVFVNISFVGSDQLANDLGPEGRGVFITQVVPHPFDESFEIVRSYRSALSAMSPNLKPGYVSFEGYIVGRAVIEALKRMGNDMSCERLLKAFAERPMDLGGFIIDFTGGKTQGSTAVFVTVIDESGKMKPISSMARI